MAWPQANGEAMFTAGRANDVAAVQRFIAAGADVVTPRTDAWTLLKDAAYFGRVELMKVIFNAGGDPSLNYQGKSAAAWAKEQNQPATHYLMSPLCGGAHQIFLDAARGRVDEVRRQLDAGVAPDIAAPDGATLIDVAGRWGQWDVVAMLHARLAPPESLGRCFSYFAQSMRRVAGNGSAADVQTMLDSGANVNVAGIDGVFPIVAAAQSGNVDVVAAALRADGLRGADVRRALDAVLIPDGCLPVVSALYHHDADAADAEVSRVRERAMLLALQNNDLEFAAELLSRGADARVLVNKPAMIARAFEAVAAFPHTTINANALRNLDAELAGATQRRAIADGKWRAAGLLASGLVIPEEFEGAKRVMTPLFVNAALCHHLHPDALGQLIRLGADPANATDAAGKAELQAAFHAALKNRREPTAFYLLELGAVGINHGTDVGRGALPVAVSSNCSKECIERLVALGANRDATDAEGRTAWRLALANNVYHDDLVEALRV